jgi:hypothetical protein
MGEKMKKLLLVSVLLITAVSTVAQVRTDEKKTTVKKATGDTTFTESVIISESVDITPRNNMLIINPLKFILFYNLSYYHKVSESVVAGGGIQFPTISGVNGIGFNAEVRFHPTGRNMRGFYLAPNISYNSLSAEDGKADLFSIGALVGWQWFPGDEFAIGLGIGIDYYTGSAEDDNDFERYSGSLPALRFDIGYAW